MKEVTINLSLVALTRDHGSLGVPGTITTSLVFVNEGRLEKGELSPVIVENSILVDCQSVTTAAERS